MACELYLNKLFLKNCELDRQQINVWNTYTFTKYTVYSLVK